MIMQVVTGVATLQLQGQRCFTAWNYKWANLVHCTNNQIVYMQINSFTWKHCAHLNRVMKYIPPVYMGTEESISACLDVWQVDIVAQREYEAGWGSIICILNLMQPATGSQWREHRNMVMWENSERWKEICQLVLQTWGYILRHVQQLILVGMSDCSEKASGCLL